MENNWNLYRTYFPKRYWQNSHFDEELKKLILSAKPQTVLDVGGGAEGTEVLKDFSNLEVYLLDPNIDAKPEWMKGTIDWNNSSDHKFDLIVLRGCINYLTLDQMTELTLWLNKGGMIIANTFLNPPSTDWTERPVENQALEVGVERFRLVDNVVEHQLKFDRYEINHSFYYYTLEQYFEAFKVLGYTKYGTNSVILKVCN